MALCPNGHDSPAEDFCDICGMRIGGPASAGSASPAADPAASAAAATPAEPCPTCGAGRTGQFCEACGYDFSAAAGRPAAAAGSGVPAPAAAAAMLAPSAAEAGQVPAAVPGSATGPLTAGMPPATGGAAGAQAAASGPGAGIWTAVVTADRDYFDSVLAHGGPDAASIEFPGYCPVRRFRLSGAEMRIGRRSASRGLEPEIDLTGPPTDTGISHLHAVLTAEPDGSWSVLDPGSANGTQVNGQDIAAGVRVPVHDGDRICVGGWTQLTIQAG